MMTNRERLLAILDGKSPDRIPWIPRFELWYTAHRIAGTLPPEYRDMRLADIYRDLRLGNPAVPVSQLPAYQLCQELASAAEYGNKSF